MVPWEFEMLWELREPLTAGELAAVLNMRQGDRRHPHLRTGRQIAPQLRRLVAAGFLRLDDTIYRLTPTGELLLAL